MKYFNQVKEWYLGLNTVLQVVFGVIAVGFAYNLLAWLFHLVF